MKFSVVLAAMASCSLSQGAPEPSVPCLSGFVCQLAATERAHHALPPVLHQTGWSSNVTGGWAGDRATPPKEGDVQLFKGHDVYDSLAGRWDASMKAWPRPGAEPEQREGVSRYEWVLAAPGAERGRFLRQEFRAELMGSPYQGLGYWGYDDQRRIYTNVWMDSTSPRMTISSGEYDERERRLTLKSVVRGPDDAEWRVRIVLTFIDADRHMLEYFRSTRQVPEYKVLEVVYTRPEDGEGARRPAARD